MTTPKISIISPSRNNGSYLRPFIESLLNQTEQDFEVILVDDGSTDDTVALVESYGDPRLKIVSHPFHMGLNAGINHAVTHASAPIIAKVDSDDIAEPNYLQRILETFAAHPEAGSVYVSLSCIDENGDPLPRKFRLKPEMTRVDCLRTIFFVRNCLNSPGQAFKKAVLAPYIPLDLSVMHYADSQMHISLLLYNETVILDEYLMKYRRISSKKAKNVSARNAAAQKRTVLETESQMNTFLHIKDTTLLLDIFGDNQVLKDYPPVNETIPFLLGLMALTSEKMPKKIWGYRTIARFIAEEHNFALVYRLYGFDFQRFLNLIEKSGIEIIVNKSNLRLIRFLRKLYAPYDRFRRMMKAKRKVY